jgi:hypothetical protein
MGNSVKMTIPVLLLAVCIGCAEPYLPAGKEEIEPPEIVETFPNDGEIDVEENISVKIRFSKGMSPLTVHEGTFTMETGRESVNFTITQSDDWTEVEIIPDKDLAEGSVYTVKVARTATDINGIPLHTDGTDSPYRFSFTTTTVYPEIEEVFPSENDIVSPDEFEFASVKFSKSMDPATINESTFFLADIPGTVVYDNQTATAYFTPGYPLSYGTDYKIIITGNVRDTSGNVLGEDFISPFTTTEE